MYPLSSYIVFIEGAIGLIFGFYAAVTAHGSQFTSNGTGVHNIAGSKALGIGVASLGVNYIIAASQKNRQLIWAFVPCRLLAFLVYWPYGGIWWKVALVELGFGGSIAFAMSWEHWSGQNRGKEKNANNFRLA